MEESDKKSAGRGLSERVKQLKFMRLSAVPESEAKAESEGSVSVGASASASVSASAKASVMLQAPKTGTKAPTHEWKVNAKQLFALKEEHYAIDSKCTVPKLESLIKVGRQRFEGKKGGRVVQEKAMEGKAFGAATKGTKRKMWEKNEPKRLDRLLYREGAVKKPAIHDSLEPEPSAEEGLHFYD